MPPGQGGVVASGGPSTPAETRPTSCGRTPTVRPRSGTMNGTSVIGGGARVPQSGGELDRDRNRRLQRRRPSRHPVAERQRPGRDLGDERDQRDRRRRCRRRSRAQPGAWSEPATSTTTAIPTSCGRTRWAGRDLGDERRRSVIGGGLVGADPGPGWTAVGTGDFNDDGHSDILWQNTERPSRDLGNERRRRDRRRPRRPRPRSELEGGRNRRLQRRRPFRHPVPEHERPGGDLGNERAAA